MTTSDQLALVFGVLGAIAFLCVVGVSLLTDADDLRPREWPCCDDCGEPTDPEMLSIVWPWDVDRPLYYCPDCAKMFAQDHPEYR